MVDTFKMWGVIAVDPFCKNESFDLVAYFATFDVITAPAEGVPDEDHKGNILLHCIYVDCFDVN